jgi:hypothetical protein
VQYRLSKSAHRERGLSLVGLRVVTEDGVAPGGGTPDRGERPAGFTGDLKLALGCFGSALLFLGVFLPLHRLPELGSVNFFWNGFAAGALLLALVAASLVALAAGRFWLLWLTGAAAAGAIGHALVRSLRGPVEPMQLEWGWPVLVIGASLQLVAAEIARRQRLGVPRRARGLALAAAASALVVVAVPRVLSTTQRAWGQFRDLEKRDVRREWDTHESAREQMQMATVIAERRVEQRQEEARRAEEARAAELEEARRRQPRPPTRVDRVAAVRRWYPRFADNVRPVLAAHAAGAAALDGAPAALPGRSLAEEVREAAKAYPRGPDSEVNGIMARLFDLYVAPATCADRGLASGAAAEPCERELDAVLDALAGELAAYCLSLPEPRPAAARASAPLPPVGSGTKASF